MHRVPSPLMGGRLESAISAAEGMGVKILFILSIHVS